MSTYHSYRSRVRHSRRVWRHPSGNHLLDVSPFPIRTTICGAERL